MFGDLYWCRGWVLGLRHLGSRSTNGHTYAGATERHCYPDTGPTGSYGYAYHPTGPTGSYGYASYHPTDTDSDADTDTAAYVDTRANCNAYTGTPNGDSDGRSSHADRCANSGTGLGAV